MTDQIFQSSFSQKPGEDFLGQVQEAFNSKEMTTRIARGRVKAGYGVFRVAGVGANASSMLDCGECYQIPDPGLAADVDAIATGTVVVSSASAQTILAASCDGVVAGAEMQPPRKLTFTFSASTDWDPTTGVVTYINQDGQSVTENLSVATSAALTTTGYARQFVSLYLPAQTGTGGTATIGVAALTLAIADFLGVARRQPIKVVSSANSIYNPAGVTSTTVTCDYFDGEAVPVLTKGGIAVFTEEATVENDAVYVRVASGAGGSTLGAFRNDADSGSCVEVVGARFTRSKSAGIGRLRLSGYGTV